MALEERKGFFANPSKVVGELFELELEKTEALWIVLLDLLKEIELSDYSGASPPLKSYEPKIANCELYAFTWESSLLKKTMYLKFAIKNDCFYYVSLHQSRPKTR
ncbi:MAG: hypothetical protein HN411_03335 [Waddliaceae bacterium]|nr:hypothetical protein [Waddliaceae bacterium]MBT6928985.1 hypothetical protein [Waddliaceae bacterium]MBT7461573.1 hypothetical protein [Waddliaceae bacterium]